MLDPKIALEVAGELSILRYFPPGPEARATIAQLLMCVCSTKEQAQWLSRRILNLYNEWPGPMEIRAVLCSKFRPADGVEANSTDKRFIEWGIPRESRAIDDHEPRAIESADPDCRALIRSITDGKRLM